MLSLLQGRLTVCYDILCRFAENVLLSLRNFFKSRILTIKSRHFGSPVSLDVAVVESCWPFQALFHIVSWSHLKHCRVTRGYKRLHYAQLNIWRKASRYLEVPKTGIRRITTLLWRYELMEFKLLRHNYSSMIMRATQYASTSIKCPIRLLWLYSGTSIYRSSAGNENWFEKSGSSKYRG